MASLSDSSLDSFLTMLKGEPGTRKSTAALSYPTPQFWFSWDKKMEAMVLPAKRMGVDLRQVDYEDYNDWDTPRGQLERFQLNCKYRTIICDSVTSTGDGINRQTRKFKNTEGKGKMVGGIPTNSIEDYNAEASAFSEFIALLKDIQKYHNINVILIAHVVGQRKNDDDNKLTHHSRVIVTGGDKISAKIAAYCTEVYHFNIKPSFDADKEGQYALFTTHTGNDFARTCLDLPNEIVFNAKPLYPNWIEPSIRKLKEENTTVTKFPTQPTTNTTTTTPKNSFSV